MANQMPTTSALRALALEFKSNQEEPVEGFCVKLANDDNLFEWVVSIFGPPCTLYEGGYFKVCYTFAFRHPLRCLFLLGPEIEGHNDGRPCGSACGH